MVYQYIFGRDTETGYKTINASAKLKEDGEYVWQNKLNIDYTTPVNITENYPEPVVYFNIKNETTVLGKIFYQTLQPRNNYMQHYYLLDGIEHEEFLENNCQFDIKHFEANIEAGYRTNIENQDIYTHSPFPIELARSIISNQKISKKVFELIIFACFEVIPSDKRISFINQVSDKKATDANLDLLRAVFSILPPTFKEKLGFITYYKYLTSPVGKTLRSDIKIIFTENSEHNQSGKKRFIEDGNFLFDLANDKTDAHTENILYGNLLEFLTEPFFIEKPIDEIINVMTKLVSYFIDPYKITYNLASIAYEVLHRGRSIDYETADILFDNFEILGEEIKNELRKWFLSNKMITTGNETNFYSLIFKANNYDEYKDCIAEFFAKQICNKQIKYIDVLFENQTPAKLMENTWRKLLNDERFLEGGIFLLHRCILNCKDNALDVFHPIDVFDVIKYFSQFSREYYKYFDELEVFEIYFKDNIDILDITGFENLSNSFSKLILSVSHEATAARLRILHRLILKKYLLTHFELIGEYKNLQTGVDSCFKLLNCTKPEGDYFQKDLEYYFRNFSLNLMRNISEFTIIDYYFIKAIENYKSINTFLNIIEEMLIKSFSKENLSTDEYSRIFAYAKQLGIKIDTRKIENFGELEFNSKLKHYISDNNITDIIKLIENQGSYLKADSKNQLITWLKKSYKGQKDNEFYRLIIYLYADDYNIMFSFIDKNDNYESLKTYMKEMRILKQANNKQYIEFLADYIKDNTKLKKYIKNLSPVEKKELGLNDLIETKEKPTSSNNPFILYIVIYILATIAIFLLTRTINSIFGIQNTLLTSIINILTLGAMFGFWILKLQNYAKSRVPTYIISSALSVFLLIIVTITALSIFQPKNLFVSLYKNLYAIKYDTQPPVNLVDAVYIEDNGIFNIVTGVSDKIDINEEGNAVIILNIQDESEFTTTVKLNNIEKKIEGKNVIKLNGKELDGAENKLIITSEDEHKNKSELLLNIIAHASVAEDKITAMFASSIYTSKDIPTEYPDLKDGAELSVPEGGRIELSFEMEIDGEYSITAELNNALTPLQSFTFSDNGCRGKFNFHSESLQATNTLKISILNGKVIKEYNFNVVKQ